MAISDSRRLDFRMVPHLSAVFSEADTYPLLETQKKPSARLGKLRTLLTDSGDLGLSESRRLDFRMVPHLSAVL